MTLWVDHAMWWHVYPLGFVGAAIRPEGVETDAAHHRLDRIEAWLDHVVELGLNGLALGPVFASSTHGYDTTDHFRIDPRLGDESDFDRLVAAAHERGVRVLLDGVFHHVGRAHPAFRAVEEHGPGVATAELFDAAYAVDCTSGKGMELYTDSLLSAVREGTNQAGRSFEDFDRMIEIKLFYDTDYDVALGNTRFWAPLALSREQKHDITDPIEMEKAAAALPTERIASRWIVGADPDAVVKQVNDYVDTGFNHLAPPRRRPETLSEALRARFGTAPATARPDTLLTWCLTTRSSTLARNRRHLRLPHSRVQRLRGRVSG